MGFVMCGCEYVWVCNVWMCVCVGWFCNVWVCVRVGLVMFGCVYVWVCNVWMCVCVGFLTCECEYVWVLSCLCVSE